MQLLPYILICAVVLFLQAVASKPLHELSRDCNYYGHKVNGLCECQAGTHGDRCEKLTTRMCGAHGECGEKQYCLYKNIDCLYREDCKDRRGWCLPLDEFPHHN